MRCLRKSIPETWGRKKRIQSFNESSHKQKCISTGTAAVEIWEVNIQAQRIMPHPNPRFPSPGISVVRIKMQILTRTLNQNNFNSTCETNIAENMITKRRVLWRYFSPDQTKAVPTTFHSTSSYEILSPNVNHISVKREFQWDRWKT